MTAKEQATPMKQPARGPRGRGGESLSVRELTQRQYDHQVLHNQELGNESPTYLEFLDSKGLQGLKSTVERENKQSLRE